MSIELQSFNQILGNMIRKIIAETPLSDINAGSVLLSLLEACASNDFENNVAILNILELLNIDAVRNNDLDSRAGDYGLTRFVAQKALGLVTISNTNITKQSTGLYIIKPAPISGQDVLYVNNTTGWASSGTLYIGRGTEEFEGPIPYTSITVFPTYSKIFLGSALQKDHLSSDTVINSQGQPDRIIAAGTIVKIPANNETPDVLYVTLRDAILPAGEDNVSNVQVVAVVPGSQGNALINTITQFDTIPFAGAAVTNTSSFSSGTDIETDTQLRNRIKAYSTTLARGTAPAILAAVKGISDPVENKQVVSAVIDEPVTIGTPAILYIDDGTGFQPSYAGQSVDVLLANANGTEQYLQLANFPLPRPQVVNTAIGPYTLTDSMFLRVAIDGVEDTVVFTTSDFVNISSATVSEIVVAINAKSTLFKARLANNSQSILIYPVVFDAEIIQVSPLRITDVESLYVNSILKFPTTEFSYIALFQNSTRLVQKNKAATVETVPFASWNITTTGNLVLSVDGTPAQDAVFTLGDFEGAPSSFSVLTLDDWVTAFNKKIAGITAVATPSQTMQISSNKVGSGSSIDVTGGTYLGQLFSNLALSAVGQTSQFEINRETGNIKILTKINVGDVITAGIADAKGFAISSETLSGSYNVASDSAGRPAEMVILTDSTFCNNISVPLTSGSTMTVSDQGGGVMRIMSSTFGSFSNLQPGYFVYIVSRTAGWLSPNNCGIFKLVARGNHLTANVDTYIEVLNANITPESATVVDATDIKGFTTDGYPQIWRGIYTSNPPAATLDDIVSSLNTAILGVNATVFRSNSVKLTSVTETGGSIAIPISVGNASSLFAETPVDQFGNPSEIANRVSDKSLLSLFKRSAPTTTNVWLGRETVTSITGALTADAQPDVPPFSAPYSETIQATGVLTPANVDYPDIVAFTRGDNKGLFKSIAAEIVTDSVGTQQGTPRTEFDHIIGDEITLMKSLSFSADDNVVFIMDNNPSIETIDVKMARTGQVNSGSNSLTFLPTTTEFSANDADNEPGIDFGNANVWSTTLNHTNFNDYAVLMRARNWYSTGGVSGSGGKMLIRAQTYGIDGNLMQFAIKYPQTPNSSGTTVLLNSPSSNLLSYFFGSGADRAVAISSGSNISVKGPYPSSATNFPNGSTSTGNYYDYTFSSGSFAPVQVGDVLSINPGSGVSNFNAGQFGVKAISGNTVRVLNPTASPTSPGSPTVNTVTTVADVVGTPTNVTINTQPAAGLDGSYFTIYDNAGSVKIWFDVDNNGTAEPVSPPTNRKIKIATLVSADTAAQVAVKIRDYLLNDVAFTSVFSVGIQVLYTLAQNGPAPTPTDGSPATGFTFVNTPGTADQSLSGKYFYVYDDVGSVAVWYDVGDVGTAQPFAGAGRYIRVSTVNKGDSANTVAAATVASIDPDSKFLATAVGATMTITTAFNAAVPNANAGTSGFTVGAPAPGSLTSAELIANAGQIHFFPLTGTAVSNIITALNAGKILVAAAIGSPSLTINVSTAEDFYVYGGNSTALGYGHVPGSSTLGGQINLYDGINWVKTFENPNPNFTLKTSMTLNGVAPSVYQMNTAPNEDATLGEYFKLVPTTIKNVQHQLTQKALSQLPIIADVAVSNAGKNVQIKSKQLGSAGAVEVVGGQANRAQAYIIGEAEVTTDTSGNYLLVKTPAFPDTFAVGDIVKMENQAGVNRLSRIKGTDRIDVTNTAANTYEYNYDPKATNFTSSTAFTIVDVSSTYGRPAGFVWRWTPSVSANLSDVVAGDLVMAYGSLSGSWSQGNKARVSGDGRVAGLPIINVDPGFTWFDVVNTYGKAMSSTTMGTGTVQICPTPIIKWNLAHAANTNLLNLTSNGTTVTATAATAHFLNTGDSVSIQDSGFVPDGVYASVTVTSATTFTFAYVSASFSENQVGASLLRAGSSRTRYRIETIGFNGLTKLSHQDGDSPRFADCGVAVDDYIVLSGSTFDSNNNGTYRVLAVDNNSIIYINENGNDQVNTTIPFNNKGYLATWTANNDLVTGIAGTFKNVALGDWVKKTEDPESAYLQVTGFTPSTPASATQISLGGNYSGNSAVDSGIAYDQANDYDKGVYLLNAEDIAFYEGDSVVVSDTLFVQNIVDAGWFVPTNTGSFVITQWGTNGVSLKPFLRVINQAGIVQANVNMSINTAGFYIIESATSKFSTYRQVHNSNIDDLNTSRRSLYLSPASRQYKFSEANLTSITHQGKLGYSTDVTIGTDGYLYYTGLLQRVQRIVDGFEPDPTNFPGRRAVGGLIETLPPLIRDIIIAITVTTGEGFNIGDVSNNIKSTIISYIEDLGVGEDVIISEIIAQVMGLKGVVAVTFNTPVPSTERIVIAKNEKATISPENIGIA